MKKLISLFAMASVLGLIVSGTSLVQAENIEVTGKSNDSNCTGGGSFDPKTVTINEGDTITFKVPVNDPSPSGLEVKGFIEGDFTVSKGASKTTKPIISDIDYYAVWAGQADCFMGDGSIVVTGTRSAPSTNTPNTSTPLPETVITEPIDLTDDTESARANDSDDRSTTAVTTKPSRNNTSAVLTIIAALTLLAAIAGFAWYYLVLRPRRLAVLPPSELPLPPITTVPPEVIEPPITGLPPRPTPEPPPPVTTAPTLPPASAQQPPSPQTPQPPIQ